MTAEASYAIVTEHDRKYRSFFCVKKWPENKAANRAEVEKMRVKITLACTECKQRNYDMMKEKKNHPEKMETKKYCKFCRTHTLHRETK